MLDVFVGHFIDLKRISANSVIIDGGACLGEFSLELRKKPGLEKVKIISIEPCPECCKRLMKEVAEPHVLFDAALVGKIPEGRKKRMRSFTGINRPWLNNVCGLYTGRGKFQEVEVSCVTLDEVHQKIGRPYVDFLKLDVEGSEHSIFKNMSKELASKIGSISVEVHDGKSIEDYMSLKDMKTLLGSFGFGNFHYEKGELYTEKKA